MTIKMDDIYYNDHNSSFYDETETDVLYYVPPTSKT